MRHLLEVRHPIFLPLWRRVALTGFCFLWAGVELYTGSPGWAVLFAAIGAYLTWAFFIIFDPAEYQPKDDT